MFEWLLWGLTGSQYYTGEILVFVLSFLHANRENRLSGEVLTAEIIPAARGRLTSRQLLGTVAAIRFPKYKIKTNVNSILGKPPRGCVSHIVVTRLSGIREDTKSFTDYDTHALIHELTIYLMAFNQKLMSS